LKKLAEVSAKVLAEDSEVTVTKYLAPFSPIKLDPQ
jgi:hypothetical protein